MEPAMTDTVTGGENDTVNSATSPLDDTPDTIQTSKETPANDGSSFGRVARDFATVLGVAIMIVLLVWVAVDQIFPEDDDFKIDASAVHLGVSTETDGAKAKLWRISGAVTDDGELAPESHVLVVLRDDKGNRFPAEFDATDGKFSVDIKQLYDRTLSEPPAVEVIEIFARQEALEIWSNTASLELHLSGLTRANWKEATARPFTFVLGLFLFTALVTIVRLRRSIWNQLKYYLCISLALLFTVSMVYLIGVTSLELSNASKDHPTPLGFAYVYFDSYVKDAPDDWNFSLTAPATKPAPKVDEPDADVTATTAAAALRVIDHTNPATGFGAPFWVLMLSVIGSGLYTIKLVVENVRAGSTYSEGEVRSTAADIIQHQFYILFSPLGSIFVYQTLLLAGIGTKPLTIAIAALASGIALNVVLKKAWDAVAKILQNDRSTDDQNGDGDNGAPAAPVAPPAVGAPTTVGAPPTQRPTTAGTTGNIGNTGN